MTNAGPTSTDSTTERAAKAESQPSLVAVSEENLAALLRATSDAPEAEVQQAAPPPGVEAKETPVVDEPVASVPVEEAEAEAVPEPAAHQEYPAASLPPEAAPIQVTLPKTQPFIPAAPTAMPAPSRNGLAAGGIVGALILVSVVFFLWPKGHPAKPIPAVVAAPKDIAPLQLLAEPSGNGLINVRWNAQSPVIEQARDGRLVITEHDKAPRMIALDVAQLKTGHLTYQSAAESIQFDLEVNDRSGAVAKESILSLSSPAGSQPQTPREPVATVKPQVVPPAAPAKIQTPAPAAVQAAAQVPQESPAKARAFVPPTQQNREPGAVIDAPPALASAPVTPLGVTLTTPLAPVSPPPPGAPQQIRVESNLQAANLIKRVVPVYPVLARSAGIQGIVRFTAVIGKDGKIQNLKLISGPPPLVDAASEAVKRWLYRPTLLNGQPVEVITQINVNFTITGETR